jgi:SAM-dependent methyltransferase
MTHNTNEFQGFFADFYDMLHEGCGDAEQYVSLLGPCGKKILELGSGTGRIVIPLAEAGFQVTGIEFESDMISLMEKKDYPRNRLRVVQADARHFSLDERFDVILLSCNFLNHFTDAADVASILSCCRDHLEPDGCVIIDSSVPDTDYMVRSNGEEEVLTFATKNGSEIRDYFKPCYDFLNQVENDAIRLEEWKDGILLREAAAEEHLTWYYPREIRSLVREAGLKVVRESSALAPAERGIPVTSDSEEMIFFCTHA